MERDEDMRRGYRAYVIAIKTDRRGTAFTLPAVWCHGGVMIMLSVALGRMKYYVMAVTLGRRCPLCLWGW